MTPDQLKPGVAQLARALAPPPETPDLRARLSLPRDPVAITLAGQSARLTIGASIAANLLNLSASLGDQAARLGLPDPLVQWALDRQALPKPGDPALLGMLLELACLDLVEGVETALALDLRLGATPGPTTQSLGVTLEIDDQRHDLALHLTEDLAQHLADYLDSHAPARHQPDLLGIRIPVALQFGQQLLTPDEIATLEPGDVIMLEPGPALLIAGGEVAASVDIANDGPVIRSELLPLPDSSANIRFVAATAQMTLAELNALGPGNALPMATFQGSALDIQSESRTIGRGESVTIGAGTGIRILHISANR